LCSGTWDSREAAAKWQSVAATRRQFFAPATERMLDLATIPVGGRVLDAATMLDQAAMIARRQGLSNVAARAVRRVPSGRTQRDARRVGRRGLAKCRHP